MGLDIRGYSQALLIDEDDIIEDDGEAYRPDGSYWRPWPVKAWTNPHFPWSLGDSLTDGRWYDVGEPAATARFGYHGWALFRQDVSLHGIGATAETVWNHPQRYLVHNAYWLVNFADNEGVIGPEMCRLIYRGLCSIRAQMTPEWGRDYLAVVACFKAGRSGLVTFS